MIWLVFIAGVAPCPYAFAHLWARRWFRVLWCLGLLVLVSEWLRSAGAFN